MKINAWPYSTSRVKKTWRLNIRKLLRNMKFSMKLKCWRLSAMNKNLSAKNSKKRTNYKNNMLLKKRMLYKKH